MKKKKSSRIASRKPKALNASRKPSPESPVAAATPATPIYQPLSSFAFLLGWTIALFAFFTRPEFWVLIPKSYPIKWLYLPYAPSLFLGFALMVIGSIKISKAGPGGDLSSLTAKVVFALVLGLTWFLRMDDANRLPAFATSDHRFILTAAREVLDYSYHPLLFPPDYRPPFITYAIAAGWALLPKATGVFAVRFVSTLMDLVTVWALYLTGKEMGGRRMGLILMFMAAISKSLIEATKYDLGINSAVMVCTILILFLLRAFKNPSLKHFLQLGLVLGLGDYTYTPVRVWIPSILMGLWIWVLAGKERRPQTRWGWVMTLGIGAAWVVQFLRMNGPWNQMFPALEGLIRQGGGWVILGVLAFAFYRAWETRESEKTAVAWSAGAVLAGLLELPLWLHPFYNFHSNQIAIWNGGATLGGILHQVVAGYTGSFLYLFGNNGDLAPIPYLYHDCFMDYFVGIFGFAGIIFFAVRPTWPKAAILVLYAAGVLPVALSQGMVWPHLLGCLPPLFLIAGVGVDGMWRAWTLVEKAGKWAGLVFLLAVGGFFLVVNARWIGWWETQRNPDLLAEGLIQNEAAACRVYLSPFPNHLALNIHDLISDGKDVHLVNPSNPIYLPPGEKGKDLAVITWIGDGTVQDRIRKDFPGVVWQDLKNSYNNVELRWTTIPFQSLGSKPDKFFFLQTAPPTDWHREFYGDFGMARGMIRWEDSVPHWNDSLPVSFTGRNSTARLTGTWVTDTEDSYVLKVGLQNPAKLWVDGHLTVTLLPPVSNRVEGKIHLSRGTHQVELVTAFRSQPVFPDVEVHSVEQGWDKSLEALTVNNSGGANNGSQKK